MAISVMYLRVGERDQLESFHRDDAPDPVAVLGAQDVEAHARQGLARDEIDVGPFGRKRVQRGPQRDAALQPRTLEAVQSLAPLAAEAGLTLPQFALAWVLREPNVASAIIGASRPEQVDENVVASGHEVAPELFEKAERIIGAVA